MLVLQVNYQRDALLFKGLQQWTQHTFAEGEDVLAGKYAPCPDTVVAHLAHQLVGGRQLSAARRQQHPTRLQPVTMALDLLQKLQVALARMAIAGMTGVHQGANHRRS